MTEENQLCCSDELSEQFQGIEGGCEVSQEQVTCRVSRRGGQRRPAVLGAAKKDPPTAALILISSTSPRPSLSLGFQGPGKVHNVFEFLLFIAAAQRHQCGTVGMSLEFNRGHERFHLPTSHSLAKYVKTRSRLPSVSPWPSVNLFYSVGNLEENGR